MTAEDSARLARIETKVDMLVTRETDHETRIRDVERGQWKHTGSMLVLSPLMLYVANNMGLHIG